MGKTNKISLSISAANPYNSQWSRVEVLDKSVDDGELVADVFSEALQEISQVYSTHLPDYIIDKVDAKQTTYNKTQNVMLTEDIYINQLKEASSFTEVKTYEKLANNPKYPNLKKAYDEAINRFQ